MPRLRFKNTFGSQGSGLDLQRTDLFKIRLTLPSVLNLSWGANVEFAVENFPFPERTVEMIPVKYMQQTNHLIGADTATPAVDIKVRYAFAQNTAQALEKWFYLIRNPETGGVGLTSQVKTWGKLSWQIPNMPQQIADIQDTQGQLADNGVLTDGLEYFLEGCLIKGLKFSDADMLTSAYVMMTFSLQIDRYYPWDVQNMQALTNSSTNT